jgi:hypothetical protein
LSRYSRTQAASYVDEKAIGGASTKIASFLTPSSSLFVIDTHEKKIVYTNYMPFTDQDYIEPVTEVIQPINLQQHVEFDADGHIVLNQDPYKVPHAMQDHDGSHARYWYYVLYGVPNEIVAPMPDAWKDKVMRLLSTDLSLVSQEAIDASLRTMLSEMVGDYRNAVKRSVVDYALRSPKERRRVNILHPPQSVAVEWGVNDKILPPNPAWRAPIQVTSFSALSFNCTIYHISLLLRSCFAECVGVLESESQFHQCCICGAAGAVGALSRSVVSYHPQRSSTASDHSRVRATAA